MRQRNISGIVRRKGWHTTLMRGLLFGVLGLFCLYYLVPLIVMISTSLKSLEEIRGGTLLSLPQAIRFFYGLPPQNRKWHDLKNIF